LRLSGCWCCCHIRCNPQHQPTFLGSFTFLVCVRRAYHQQPQARMASKEQAAAETISVPSSSLDNTVPRVYLLLENPSKGNNLGPILRCANAFGITTIVAIGYAKCAVHGAYSLQLRRAGWPCNPQNLVYLLLFFISHQDHTELPKMLKS